jgi:Na+/proline symporter
MNIFSGVFFGFLFIYLLVTIWTGRKGVNLGDFYTMDANAKPYLIAGTYAATWISAIGIVGLTGMSYKTGPLTGILVWGCTVGFVISTFWIGPKLRRVGQVTLGDFFGERFDSDSLRLASAVITILGMGT